MSSVQTQAALLCRRLPNAGFQQRCSVASRQRMRSRVQCPTGRRLTAPNRAVAAAAGSGGVTLTLPCGSELAMPKAALVIGSAADADVRLQGSDIAPQHVRLEHKGGRLFCTALSGDPDLLLSATHCWLDGVELRPGVSYMVAPGACIAVGSQDNCVACSFQEGGSSGVAELMLKGLAAGASKEVQEKLDL